MSTGPVIGYGLISVVFGHQSGTDVGFSGAKIDLKKKLFTTIFNLNFIFILICFYTTMVMTNWGTLISASSTTVGAGVAMTSVAAGSVSMWMQATGAWSAIALYMVALLMPNFNCCPNGVWDLQMHSA